MKGYMDDKFDELKALLGRQDWYYDRSDDSSIYRLGADNWKSICSLKRELIAAGHGEAAEALIKKAAG